MYKSFKEMPVWKSAMDVGELVFRLTDTLPKREDYGLTSQIRRSAVSISANIAEAFGRKHTMDKINFYYIARGSLTETQSHLVYGQRVGYFDEEKIHGLEKKLVALHNDLNRLIRSLRK
ncbi:MAG: four helix bundle protein [Deltaproteobacteria bacterium]|jgi:four helix bundle protein